MATQKAVSPPSRCQDYIGKVWENHFDKEGGDENEGLVWINEEGCRKGAGVTKRKRRRGVMKRGRQ